MNHVAGGELPGLLVESTVLALPALVVLAVLASQGTLTWRGHGAGHDVQFATAGAVTAVPLLFFAGAAHRLPLSTLGLLQYLAPVLQFLTGVLVRHEPMPLGRLAALGPSGWRSSSCRSMGFGTGLVGTQERFPPRRSRWS